MTVLYFSFLVAHLENLQEKIPQEPSKRLLSPVTEKVPINLFCGYKF